MLTDEKLFTKNGLAKFHDAVLDGSDKSIQGEQLKALFIQLPVDIQDMARQWGLSDTVVGDSICVWAREHQSAFADQPT